MIKQEYINSLSVEQLKSLVDTFSEMLLDQGIISYTEEDEKAEYEDEDIDLGISYKNLRTAGFYCEYQGKNFLYKD
jgi:hypothetical protein